LGGDEGVSQGDRFGHSLMNETTRFGVLRILLERAVRFCLTVGTLFGLGSEFRPSLAQGSDAISISNHIPKRHSVMRTFSGI
jgi:hypothetical protein